VARKARSRAIPQTFAENGIDVSVLHYLTDQDLEKIGVLLGHRRKILAAIAELKKAVVVEGHSKDGTWEEIQRVVAAYPQYDIKAMLQPRKGKADAVFAAFDAVCGDVLMILDADLTMPPEQLTQILGCGPFGNRRIHQRIPRGDALSQPRRQQGISILFTWLLSQRFTDTLSRTKVLRRSDYMRLKAGRDFDPFGDFDLIFGAAKLSLKVVEISIRYASRMGRRSRGSGTGSC
jgi:glycosyltransferase involved in cell wall biosynthesis